MATNPPSGDGHRNGAIKGRTQSYNPKTGLYTKRDTGNWTVYGCKNNRRKVQRRHKRKTRLTTGSEADFPPRYSCFYISYEKEPYYGLQASIRFISGR